VVAKNALDGTFVDPSTELYVISDLSKVWVLVDVYEAFAGSDLFGEMALERMITKLSTHRYRAGLEPVGEAVEATARSTSKSSVSRRFVAAPRPPSPSR
jgi:hypothetical protein